MDGTRKVFVKSYGCQMNVYDAGRMVDVLSAGGFSETSSIAEADLVILNTCHIREKAAEKIFSELGKIRLLKQERRRSGQDLMVAVAGCVAQAEGAEIIRRQKSVDLVVGPQSYHRLPDLVSRAALSPGVVDTDFPTELKFDHLPSPSPVRIRERGVTAFVTIQEGCDKFCSFCVVPYTRGSETSREPEAILREIEELAASGVREVTLLGQNVNAYHGRGADGSTVTLAALVAKVAAIRGIVRVRYTTSHPNDMQDDLIEAHRDLPELMPFLHLPVQSGSDRILAAMNRKHRAKDYISLVSRVRKARPDIALSSDFIVGFPGETEEDFQATLALIREVGFATTFSFKYSSRPGTPGSEMPEQVGESERHDRLLRLQELVSDQRDRFNAGFVGQKTDVLLERAGRHPGQLVGKTPYLQAVQVNAPADMIGEVAEIEIVGTSSNSLFGEFVREQTAVSGNIS